ncbi:MAG: sulfite exporter TauE/SafE family protein [Gammaproteobacteria bacterium]
MLQYLLVFVAGMAGSFHCAGMCGGFACGLTPDPRGKLHTSLRHFTYNSGRGITYVFLGTFAGVTGGFLQRGGIIFAERTLALTAGLFMVLMALKISGYLAHIGITRTEATAGRFLIFFRRLLATPGVSAPFAFGLANGFLPCPLVYAFLARAAATGTPLTGAATMAAFALGTFPMMLLLGGLGPVLRYQWRKRGAGVAAVFLLLLGVITALRAFIPLQMHMHMV